MNRSEQIEQLAVALSGLQGELEDAHKGKQGYGYTYADLPSVLAQLRPLLHKHGLSIMQPVSGHNGEVTITTIVMHVSGQYIESAISVSVDMTNKKMNSLQAAGSSITYLRRYCLMSIIGLSSTDDDGKSGGDHLDESIKELRTFIAASSLTSTANEEIISKAMVHYGVNTIESLSANQLQSIVARINKG